MKKFYAPLFIFSIFSCSHKVSYVGSKYTPTDKVDVYVDASAIIKPYIIVGKGYTGGFLPYAITNKEKILRKAVAKARQFGADAVFLRDYFIQSNGASIITSSKTDSMSGGNITVSQSSIQPNSGYINSEILFLKYK